MIVSHSPRMGSRMTFPRFDTSRIATGLTVGGIASSSMRSRLTLAFAPAVFGALRDLRNNYAAALALAGALQCAAAALVLAAKPRHGSGNAMRRSMRSPVAIAICKGRESAVVEHDRLRGSAPDCGT